MTKKAEVCKIITYEKPFAVIFAFLVLRLLFDESQCGICSELEALSWIRKQNDRDRIATSRVAPSLRVHFSNCPSELVQKANVVRRFLTIEGNRIFLLIDVPVLTLTDAPFKGDIKKLYAINSIYSTMDWWCRCCMSWTTWDSRMWYWTDKERQHTAGKFVTEQKSKRY